MLCCCCSADGRRRRQRCRPILAITCADLLLLLLDRLSGRLAQTLRVCRTPTLVVLRWNPWQSSLALPDVGEVHQLGNLMRLLRTTHLTITVRVLASDADWKWQGPMALVRRAIVADHV
uniref:(northern house mosquito) hypothetical protein n=1 Tax=Culex pipiens TaxID=7175 RepID=A0A8D8D019_CULPI